MPHHERCATHVDPILRCTCERQRDFDRQLSHNLKWSDPTTYPKKANDKIKR